MRPRGTCLLITTVATCLLVTVLPHPSWKEDGGCEVVAEADEDSLSVDTCEAGELLVAGSNVFTG